MNIDYSSQGSIKEWVRCNYGLSYTKEVTSVIPYHLNLTTRGFRTMIYRWIHYLIILIHLIEKQLIEKKELELTDIFLKIKEKKTKMKHKSWIKLSPLKWLFFMLLFSTYSDMLQFLILLQWRSWCHSSFCGDTCMDKIPQFFDYWWMAIMVCWWPDCRVKQCFFFFIFSFSFLLFFCNIKSLYLW